MPNLKLQHNITFLRSLGGMQSAAQRHLNHDKNLGLRSDFNVFFESNDPEPDRVNAMGWSGWTSIGGARRSMKKQLNNSRKNAAAPDLALYYNFWGAPILADLDRAKRRVGVLHSPWVGIEDCLQGQRGLMDGALCINQPLVDLVLKEIPELGPDRVRLLPVAIRPHEELNVNEILERPAKPHGDPIVIGVCGRVSKEQKRVDRLPDFCEAMDRAEKKFRLEILGDGPESDWLKSKLSHRKDVVFHGTKRGLDYWKTISEWDCILFVSDYEGIPIALMECMALGVVPIYPDINSGAESYLREVDSDCVYPAWDFEKLIEQLDRILQRTSNPTQWVEYKKSFRKPISAHLSDQYDQVYQSFVEEIISRPALVKNPIPYRSLNLWDSLPFGALNRIHPSSYYRSGVSGLS